MQDAPPPLGIDFAAGPLTHRLRSGAGRGGALARAVGIKPGRLPAVVDATAGLGRDAFVLASLGCAVTLIERHPAVHGALAAALMRARGADAPADVAGAAARMTLLAGDARSLLPGLGADVVLVDPMHPDRGNTALVKQPMRALRAVVGADADVAELMAVALAAARRRVVLKWPRLAGPVAGLRAPSHVIEGRTTRYDVFMVG
jgi:16S rRNA (guanine1516-N2)-methyltransferase